MEKKYKTGESWREKDIGEERGEKEGQTERWKVLWREGYLCLGVVGTAGRLLKGSQV